MVRGAVRSTYTYGRWVRDAFLEKLPELEHYVSETDQATLLIGAKDAAC